MAEEAAWCGLCGAPRAPAESDLLLAEMDAAAVRAPVLPGWRPEARHVTPAPPTAHSRWFGGALSFGPAAKIALTVATTFAWVWFLLYSNSPGSGLILAAMSPLAYREIWRRHRIR